MQDFIPRSDSEFDAWQSRFVTSLTAHLTDLGLTPGDVVALLGQQTAWAAGLAAHCTAQTAARGAREGKDSARRAYESGVRSLARRLQASPAVSDAERKSLGLRVSDTVRTRVAVPSTRPVVKVVSRDRLRHIIYFYDLREGGAMHRAKPAGVMGVEIWFALGALPPGDARACNLLGVYSRSPCAAEFGPGDGGKTAHYMLRWVNRRGERGPWSETASATLLA